MDYKRPCKLLNDTNCTVGLYLIDLDRTMGQNGGMFLIVFIQTNSQQYKARPSGREGGLNITYLHPISLQIFVIDCGGHVKMLQKLF